MGHAGGVEDFLLKIHDVGVVLSFFLFFYNDFSRMPFFLIVFRWMGMFLLKPDALLRRKACASETLLSVSNEAPS